MGGTASRRARWLAGAIVMGSALAGGMGYWHYRSTRRPASVMNLVMQPTGNLHDNSTCLVCHIDLETEDLAAVHLEAGIVCAGCHGASESHRSDEENITKPDYLFGRAEIAPFCKSCHRSHTSSHQYQAFVKEWSGQRRPNGRMILETSTCTDCHGNHAILRPDQQRAEVESP